MSESTSTTRKERRAASRRLHILEHAAGLFAEKGFHRTTTRDIAAAADVSEGTLYNYFDSKDEILLGIMSMLAEASGLPGRLEEAVEIDPQAFLQSILRLRRQQVDATGDMLQAVLSEILVNPPLRQRYYAEQMSPLIEMIEYHLNQRADLGQIRRIDKDLVARIIVGLVTGLFFLQVMGDPVVVGRWGELSKVIAEILAHGILDAQSSPFKGADQEADL